MHCHMIPHITPYPARADTLRTHDAHDVTRHPASSMAGLVLGITTVDAPRRAGSNERAASPPRDHRRLLAQEARADSGKPAPRGYVLQRGTAPRRDSVEIPGSMLVLTRGATTSITVVNHLAKPTTVHWHGLELESVYDGVSGWSGAGARLAPLVAPRDSFTVVLTPPRAGTFIYHTHMDEEDQLPNGMYGPLLVLEPGERYDPATDLVLVLGQAVVGGKVQAVLNGRTEPAPLALQAGTRYRLRLINMLPVEPARVRLHADSDSTPVAWRFLAKDGAALARARQRPAPAELKVGVGETYDFEWTPAAPADVSLVVRLPDPHAPLLRQRIRVR